MSHELRTPLNAIMGFAQLLELNKSSFTQTQLDNINEILMAGKHLLTLINEILDLSRIESGKQEILIQEANLNQLILECIQLVQPQLNEQQLNLHDNLSINNYIVLADYSRLKQILLNLLSNAIKYNRPQGDIVLDSELIEAQRLRIKVTDTGNGLEAYEINKLFKPFERLSARNDIEGTGIGLVITKNLIELMDGSIGVDSHPGKGSTFWIELPIKA